MNFPWRVQNLSKKKFPSVHFGRRGYLSRYLLFSTFFLREHDAFLLIFQCSRRLAKMQQASTNKPRESGTSRLVASTTCSVIHGRMLVRLQGYLFFPLFFHILVKKIFPIYKKVVSSIFISPAFNFLKFTSKFTISFFLCFLRIFENIN